MDGYMPVQTFQTGVGRVNQPTYTSIPNILFSTEIQTRAANKSEHTALALPKVLMHACPEEH
jgi:hypothetical protein